MMHSDLEPHFQSLFSKRKKKLFLRDFRKSPQHHITSKTKVTYANFVECKAKKNNYILAEYLQEQQLHEVVYSLQCIATWADPNTETRLRRLNITHKTLHHSEHVENGMKLKSKLTKQLKIPIWANGTWFSLCRTNVTKKKKKTPKKLSCTNINEAMATEPLTPTRQVKLQRSPRHNKP